MRLNVVKNDASCQTDPNFKLGPLSQNDESLTNWLKGEISKDFIIKKRDSAQNVTVDNAGQIDEGTNGSIRSSGEM